jgi:multisubunit Na+/H+ antiporter MnhB subunit
MIWRAQFIDNAGEALRFIGYVFLLLAAIVLSIFTLWFTAKFIWFFSHWLDRIMFRQYW